MSAFWEAANPGARWRKQPRTAVTPLVKVATVRSPIIFEMPKLAWEFKIPEAIQPIDVAKLRKSLESLRPHNRREVSLGQGVQASCETCGWASGPVDSRESLEDLVEDKGGSVQYGGAKLSATCPMCYAPICEMKV